MLKAGCFHTKKSAKIRHDHVLYPVFLDRKKFVSSLALKKNKMADSDAAKKRAFDQDHFTLHGCRCTELKSQNNSFHVHCLCDICNGKAVPPTTAWRHKERTKRVKLTTNDQGVTTKDCATLHQRIVLLNFQLFIPSDR